MSYSVEEVNGCTKKLKFNFESVDLSNEINASLKEKQKSAKLKGYRPGKAPLSMIQSLYGPQVENQALYSFVTKEFYTAVESEGFKVVGYPKFSETNYEVEKKNISFSAEVEVLPTFDLNDYSGFEFTQEVSTITEDDVNKVKEQLLNSRSEVVAINDDNVTLDKGHIAIMNFEGEKEDGTRPENMKGSEFSLEIGSNQFIPGFEDGMQDMKKGEKKTIELTFPENYHAEDLKNAKVKFDVEVLEIKEKKLPELTDELMKEFNFDSVEDFNNKTKQRLETENKRKADEKLHQEILEKLVAENNFDLPKALIENQVTALKEEAKNSLLRSGFNESMLEEYYKKWDDDFQTRANFQVRSGLILEKLSEKYKVSVESSDLDDKYKHMAELSSMELEKIKTIYAGNENLQKNLSYAIKEEKTFAELKKEITIK